MEHLTPKQAYEFLHTTREAVFIDVRSEMEFLFVGHPDGSILIPWVDAPDWEVNPHFVSHVKTAASINRPVVLICRSGRRSVDAGLVLEQAGLHGGVQRAARLRGRPRRTYHRNTVNGWRFEGLPWTQT